MSTYWHYECLDHIPAITSEEFTQHTDDAAFRRGIELAQSRPVPEDWYDTEDFAEYFASNACRFLRQHPTCTLGMVSEYGEHRAIAGMSAPDPEAPELDPEPWLSTLRGERYGVNVGYCVFKPGAEFSQNREDYPND